MKSHYLCKNKDSKDLIIFFAGFGSEISHFSFLESKKNVLMIYDYTDFFYPQTEFEKYENLSLIAYSMGVCVASIILDSNILHFKKKIAINGTNLGINDNFGINKKIYSLTARHFSLKDFKQKLFGDFLESKNAKNFIFRSENALKDELKSLQNFYNKHCKNPKNFLWDKVIISKNDLIFPPQSTKAFFQNIIKNENQITLDSPHFIFFHFKTWEEICEIKNSHFKA